MKPNKIKLYAIHIFLIIFVILTVIPFFWMLSSSFKPASEIISHDQTFLPKAFTFDNYIKTQENFNFIRMFANSLFLASGITAMLVYTSVAAGYIFAKYEFRGKKILFGLILSTMMIPWSVTIIPKYTMMMKFGWIDSYLAFFIPALFNSFGIFLMKQSITSIPNEMIEAARMDGASESTILHKLVFPVSKNTIIAFIIFNFLWVWEDYLWPYLIISSEKKQVLSVGLKMFSGQYATDYGGLFAATSISIIPVLIVYIFFQKKFIEGVTSSSVKG